MTGLVLTIHRQTNKYALLESNSFDTIRLLGVESMPVKVEIQLSKSTRQHYDYEYDRNHKVSVISLFK